LIRTLNKQLYSLSTPTLLASLVVPFAGFFAFITFTDQYSALLVVTAFSSLLILLPFHSYLRRQQAQMDLARQELHERTNLTDAEVLREQLAIEALHQKIFNYSQLKGLTEKLGMCFAFGDACRVIGMEVNKLFPQKDVTIILYMLNSRTGELSLVSSYGGEKEVNIKAKQGDLYDRWVEKNLKPLLVEDSKSDFRFDREKAGLDEARPVRSLMSVPLILASKAVGILRLDSSEVKHFSTDDIRLLSVIGDLAAMTIENVQLYERVEDLAIRDSLTGLFLRRYFVERLAQEMSRELRRKKDLSLLMIDLDKFKHYNDNYGHSAGDIVLKTVAMILSYMFDKPGNLVCPLWRGRVRGSAAGLQPGGSSCFGGRFA